MSVAVVAAAVMWLSLARAQWDCPSLGCWLMASYCDPPPLGKARGGSFLPAYAAPVVQLLQSSLQRGGHPDTARRRPYELDAINVIFSSGKVVESMAMTMLADRGLLGPDTIKCLDPANFVTLTTPSGRLGKPSTTDGRPAGGGALRRQPSDQNQLKFNSATVEHYGTTSAADSYIFNFQLTQRAFNAGLGCHPAAAEARVGQPMMWPTSLAEPGPANLKLEQLTD
eukprot:g2495.t1